MEHSANHIVLRGALAQLPCFSHENHQKRFYSFPLEVERLSGAVDLLPVLTPEETLLKMDLTGGDMLEICGQIRTFNDHHSARRRLVISAYAESVEACSGAPCNAVELTGTVCKAPIFRRTPLGRQICDVMLAVNRPYRRADYIPCIFWGQTAREVGCCDVGSVLRLSGRLQSRDYIKVTEEQTQTRTAYEVSAMCAEILE